MQSQRKPMGLKVKVAALSLSASAIVGMAVHEGYREKAYYATPDEKARGIVTFGFGDTQGVKPTDTITVEKALVRLLARTGEFEDGLRKCVGDETSMYQYEWDAIVSWAYNVGLHNACTSTLVRKLKAGVEWCSELLRWDRQSGVVLPGLTKRRQDEYRKCRGES
jgi:lysozyme